MAAASQSLQADVLEEVLVRGWAYTSSGQRVHYEVHVAYMPESPRGATMIRSIDLTLGKQKILIPEKAFNDYSSDWEAPRDVFARYGKKNEFTLYFPSCGDGARSYATELIIHEGRLYARQIIPAGISEINDSIRIFDAKGRVIYDGPCDRQGNPTRPVKSSLHPVK